MFVLGIKSGNVVRVQFNNQRDQRCDLNDMLVTKRLNTPPLKLTGRCFRTPYVTSKNKS
jgi:hypothetical protein